jgi:predicted nicotinamide N-methyase
VFSSPLYTVLSAVPLVPEIRLHLAPEPAGLWDATAGEYRSDEPPPFWAFAWPGGQGLARYLLDHPEVVAGRRVLDLATGSGLVAIAAAKAGAARVLAVDVDPAATAAVVINAEANHVDVRTATTDVLDAATTDVAAGATAGTPDSGAGGFAEVGGGGVGDAEVVLSGDAFYTAPMAGRMLAFLRRASQGGATVLVGDPDREFLPRRLFTALASYDVPVRSALEDVTVRRTTIWRLNRRPRVCDTQVSGPGKPVEPGPDQRCP